MSQPFGMSNNELQKKKDDPPWKKTSLQHEKPVFTTASKLAMDWGEVRSKSQLQLELEKWKDSVLEKESQSLVDTHTTDHTSPYKMDKKLRLDVNRVKKSAATTPTEASRADNPRNFRDVVKTAMIVRNWMTSPNGSPPPQITSPEASVFEPTTISPDDAPILIEPHDIIPPNPSGLKIINSRLKDIYKRFQLFSFVPTSRKYYYWSLLVFLGVLYNMLGMVIFIFNDVYNNFFWQWFFLNIFFDIVYIVDIFISRRKSYMDDGLYVDKPKLLARNYRKEPLPLLGTFMIMDREVGGRIILDVVCLIPCDLFLVLNNSISLVRAIRLLKTHRFLDFVELSLKRAKFPHASKIAFLMLACFVLFHWNACVYFMFSLAEGLSEEDTGAFGFSYYKVFDPRFPTCDIWQDKCLMAEDTEGNLDLDTERPRYQEKFYEFWQNKSMIFEMGNFSREYSMSMYWSALTITTCGQQPYPSNSAQNMLEVVDTLIGVLVFATIIGSVGSVVTQMNKSVYDSRTQMDSIKFYMKYRRVTSEIQDRVLKCFMYMNSKHQLTDEQETLDCLPPSMQLQMAENLHMQTLQGVSIFNGCSIGFLADIVMKMKQQVFMPNDMLCKVGDKAKEMFIVKNGFLQVVDENNKFLEELTDGSTFGEMSIIQIKGNPHGDQRQSGLRSVGYSDVYILNQDDVIPLLSEYPEERATLTRNAHRWLLDSEEAEVDAAVAAQNDYFETNNEVYSVDERLEKMQEVVREMNDTLSNMYVSFRESSNNMKKRVTSLEETMWYGRDKIRKDILLGKI